VPDESLLAENHVACRIKSREDAPLKVFVVIQMDIGTDGNNESDFGALAITDLKTSRASF
jgi:hypothetical protein